MSGCAIANFDMYRGDTKTLVVAVMSSDGSALDVDTALGITFGLFEVETLEVVALMTLGQGITVTGNLITIVIPHDETERMLGNYTYEIEIVTVTAQTHTILQGTATVIADLITPEVLA